MNLFLSNTATLDVKGRKVTLSQKTNYPWDGDIEISIDKTTLKEEMTLQIRIPGWVRGQVVPSDLYTYSDNKRPRYTVSVNGNRFLAIDLEQGYFSITRKWKKGDKVEVHFDMEPRTVRANNNVEEDRGRVAIERGPLVYCAEHPDNSFDIMGALINQKPQFSMGKTEIAGTQVVTLTTDAQTLSFDEQGRLQTKDQRLTLIPYYAWCHRGSGKMRVWLPQDVSAVKP